MRRVMVRYKVKADHLAPNEELVRAVYDELQRTQPAGLRYVTFQLDDGVSFVHLASIETEDGQSHCRTCRRSSSSRRTSASDATRPQSRPSSARSARFASSATRASLERRSAPRDGFGARRGSRR